MRKPPEPVAALLIGLPLWLPLWFPGETKDNPLSSNGIDCTLITGSSDITSSGNYCLHGDSVASGGIEIQASDVSFDLRGFCLIGPRDNGLVNYGIHIASGTERVSITNGCVRGFFYGLKVDDDLPAQPTRDISVSKVSFQQNAFRGAMIDADQVNFRNNTISNTGGTTVYDDAFAIGLELSGDYCTVYSNLVSETYGRDAGEGVGISISSDRDDHCSVTNNVISNRAANQLGRTFGIWSDNLSAVIGNTVQNVDYAIVQPPLAVRGNNIVIDEHCHGLFYAKTEQAPGDTQISRQSSPPCPDLKEVINALKAVNRKVYFYRKAQRLAMKDKWSRATAYFLAAEKLGSVEAARIARKHLALKLVSEGEFQSAERQAANLLADK